MGIIVNPKFYDASSALIAAQRSLQRAQNIVKYSDDKSENSPEVQELRKAEIAFHNAENYWCNQQGLIDAPNSDMTQEEAERQLERKREQVLSYYA